jgi:hypothetical protein
MKYNMGLHETYNTVKILFKQWNYLVVISTEMC